jgi:arylsulfatase
MQQRMEVYAAMVDRMDQGVGRILAKLRQSGVKENTLVLFLADNGGCAEDLRPGAKALHIPARTRSGAAVRAGNDPAIAPAGPDTYQSYGPGWATVSNTPFRLYKHWVHEGGIASPLIASWPSRIRRRGAIVHRPAHLIDIMATCVDISGARYRSSYAGHDIAPMEGESLSPAFDGRQRGGRRICWEHEGNRAVRDGRWKLVARHGGAWELYDLDADRTEMNDLAARHPGKARELATAWDAWASRCHVEPWERVIKPSGNA